VTPENGDKEKIGSEEKPSSPHELCPACGRMGKPITRDTLYQHLVMEGLSKTLYWKDARVCLNPPCRCLYYCGAQLVDFHFAKKSVGYKERIPPHHLCYCFHYTGEQIEGEIRATGKSKIIEEIKGYMEKGHNWCNVTNPTGGCCLEVIEEYLKRNRLF
jgi:hypothetical protein